MRSKQIDIILAIIDEVLDDRPAALANRPDFERSSTVGRLRGAQCPSPSSDAASSSTAWSW
jgi:hypothetical protein